MVFYRPPTYTAPVYQWRARDKQSPDRLMKKR
jgi:hypothetical protein